MSAAQLGSVGDQALWQAASIEPVDPPAPVQGGRPPDELIGPGLVGFLVTFAMAVAVVFLVRDMNRRIQRVRYGRGTPAAGDPDTHLPDVVD